MIENLLINVFYYQQSPTDSKHRSLERISSIACVSSLINKNRHIHSQRHKCHKHENNPTLNKIYNALQKTLNIKLNTKTILRKNFTYEQQLLHLLLSFYSRYASSFHSRCCYKQHFITSSISISPKFSVDFKCRFPKIFSFCSFSILQQASIHTHTNLDKTQQNKKIDFSDSTGNLSKLRKKILLTESSFEILCDKRQELLDIDLYEAIRLAHSRNINVNLIYLLAQV